MPWDQALDIVLRAKCLDQRRDGNVVWVAPQKELASYEQNVAEARLKAEDNAVTDHRLCADQLRQGGRHRQAARPPAARAAAVVVARPCSWGLLCECSSDERTPTCCC